VVIRNVVGRSDSADTCGSIRIRPPKVGGQRRVVDRRVLIYLIKMWLDSPSKNRQNEPQDHTTTEARASGAAFAGAHPLTHYWRHLNSPFCLGWKSSSLRSPRQLRLVTYAVNPLILCRSGQTPKARCITFSKSW